MFFSGKKAVAPKKTALSIVDANKRAREEREREKSKQASIVTIQAFMRTKRDLQRLAQDVRAHWIVENPHETLAEATDREQWLMMAFREFLVVLAWQNPFDVSTVPKLLPYFNQEYFAIAANPIYTDQWKWQLKRLIELCLRPQKELCPSLAFLLRSATHPSVFNDLLGSSVSASTKSELLLSLHRHAGPQIESTLQRLLNPSSWQSPDIALNLLQAILDIIDNNITRASVASLLVELACTQIDNSVFAQSALSAQLLRNIITALKSLETNAKSPISPITKENYKKVAHFVQNKMKLYAVASTSPDSIESFAAEIALQLDTLNDFEKRYKQELEDEEDFLDANDVPDIEQCIRLNHTRTEELKNTMNEVSLAATTIFSEERLYGLVKKLSSAKEDSLLESFSSIAVLISRLKNTIGISTAAFLALSSPLVPLWPTLYQRYSVALPVPQIDSAASLFSLYCQSYAFFLSTQISDNDFFTKQKPLSLAHNRQMVDFFKRIVAARTLHHFQSPLTTEFISFMKSFNLLLLQLQSRNYARTWAKIDELLLPELRAVNLANPANSTHLIAQYCPMLIPMLEKVKLFNSWVTQDRFTHQGEQDGWAPNALQVNIRRGPMLLTDAFSKLMPLHARLKEKLKVQFLSEDGTPEPGIDGGGLFRELFTEVVKLAFSPDFGLFSSTAEHSLYPNPHSAVLVDESIRKFQFLGQLLGKCIYESLLVDLPFASFFLNILQGQTNTMRDLASYDSVLFASMQHLLDMSNIEDLGLTFEFGEIGPDGQNRVIELTEKGSMKAVTTKNAPIYVHMIADRRLNQAIKAQSQAFMRGLSDVIQLKWLRLFTPPELSLAICGGGRLDVEDLRSNVEFAGGFHPEHPTVLHLWDVLEELTSEDQQAFLRFVTSVSRPPLLGFGALHPRLCLRLNKTETSFLPTANTCLNLLKLPPYATKTQLKEKLLYAINSGARFELS